MGYRLCKEIKAVSASEPYSPSASAWLMGEDALVRFAEEFINLILCQVHMVFGNADDSLKDLVIEILDGREALSMQNGTFHSLSEARTALLYKKLHEADLEQDQDKQTLALLDLQVQLCEIELDADCTTDPMHWDNFVQQYEQVVELATVAVLGDNVSSKVPQFDLRPGAIAALYSVIMRCRDPIIRRRALSLLTKRHSRNGLWDSKWVSQLALRVIQVEERHGVPLSSADVPYTSRISKIEARNVTGGQYVIRYKSAGGWISEPMEHIVAFQ